MYVHLSSYIVCVFLCSLSLVGSSIASDKEHLLREQVYIYYTPSCIGHLHAPNH